MKKIVTIILLALFTFNMGGYYLVFWGLQSQAEEQLAKQLDDTDGNIETSFEIRIPLTLPYPLQQTEFERKDGKFVYKNEHYRIVKQKLESDELVIVCVKNETASHLANVMDEFSKTSGEHQSSKSILFSGKILQEYEPSLVASIISIEGWTQNIRYINNFSELLSVQLEFHSPPPKA